MKRSDTLPSTTDRRKAEASTATFMSCRPNCRGWCLTKPLTAAICTAGACVKANLLSLSRIADAELGMRVAASLDLIA